MTGLLLAFLLFAGEAPAPRPPDSTHSPNGALWRALVLPGWGQIYNRQYWKVPFVYAGLGGLAALAHFLNERYLLYRHAYLYAIAPEQYPQYREAGERFRTVIEAGRADLLRLQRDRYRRNRDLTYIALGLWYGLTVLDAYVHAHLYDFDVSENLQVSVFPGPNGTTMHLFWRF
ncbi:DUF5683 domain-containing protein [Rhodothermus profundi]|uniref:DUF5683 domain-containing protein n=1 Tax=Rhodothermus profundi TaxID=633813 RepID=A0A1M6VRE7_9BACT|nr:DUF5683 domain-containing protein [Rhodothermus profundi]SHK83911.1 hypothetical protein SAMN04488087_2078 [Rhodothermus profundi]